MEYTLSHAALTKLIARSYEDGYARCMTDFGKLPQSVSQSEAYRMFTRPVVNKWVRLGMIVPVKNVPREGKNADRRLGKKYSLMRLRELYAAEQAVVKKIEA